MNGKIIVGLLLFSLVIFAGCTELEDIIDIFTGKYAQETGGVIDRPLMYDDDELDPVTGCSPVEIAVPSSIDPEVFICKCKPGYFELYSDEDGRKMCQYQMPLFTDLNENDLKKFEFTMRTMKPYQYDIITIDIKGKPTEIIVSRKGNQEMVYSMDGEKWSGDLRYLVNPTFVDSAVDSVSSAAGYVWDGIAGVFTTTRYSTTDPEFEIKYNLATTTLNEYRLLDFKLNKLQEDEFAALFPNYIEARGSLSFNQVTTSPPEWFFLSERAIGKKIHIDESAFRENKSYWFVMEEAYVKWLAREDLKK